MLLFPHPFLCYCQQLLTDNVINVNRPHAVAIKWKVSCSNTLRCELCSCHVFMEPTLTSKSNQPSYTYTDLCTVYVHYRAKYLGGVKRERKNVRQTNRYSIISQCWMFRFHRGGKAVAAQRGDYQITIVGTLKKRTPRQEEKKHIQGLYPINKSILGHFNIAI